jgi:nucleoid DNA-binding protein
LSLPTKKEAEHIVNAGDRELGEHPAQSGRARLYAEANGFGKFYVRHKPGIRRKIGSSGETIQTKALGKVTFISLGSLRQRERVD